MKIAVLVPLCSRNQPWKELGDCYWVRDTYPALLRSAQDIEVYLGIDEDDAFFQKHRDQLQGRIVDLRGCQHAPAWAWNQLLEAAIADGHEYFFQMGDDVVFETPGWTQVFLEALQQQGNRGIVGPCHLANYEGRLREGKHPVLENAFFHKTHYDIFGYLYPPEIRNYYCDDWITEVYRAKVDTSVLVRNLSINNPQQRYVVETPDWRTLIEKGRARLRSRVRGCFSFCLYGPYTDKYYGGLLENIEIIHKHFPGWAIEIYASHQAAEYLRTQNLDVHDTHREGTINTLLRFLPTYEQRYEVVCVRDTDSRIHARDMWCIDHFLASSYSLYTIRDHAWHRYPVMAGLWGCRTLPREGRNALLEYIQTANDYYGVDADFLKKHVYNPQDLVVYSYHARGLFGDPNEKVVVIEEPIANREFCGNVMLYNPEPYYEFEPMCT